VSRTEVAGIELPQGDPAAVLDAVNRLDRMASGFEHSAQGFRRAATAVPSWLGIASLAFEGLASGLERTADQAHAAVRDSRIATRRYADELREARDRIRRLQDRASELEEQIDEARQRVADAALREQDARARAAGALLSMPFDGGAGVAFDVAAAAFDEADAAAAERRRWEDRIAELEDELERIKRRAREEREEVRRAESRAAAQIEQAAGFFPTVGSAGDTPTRRELIEGGHVLPPGKLSSEEAETYLDAYSREHGRHFSAMDRLSLLSMLTQGERPPDMRKLEELYEEPGWVKTTNEFTGLADAERALDSFADGNISGGFASLAMAAPVGPGKLAKLGKLDNVVRGADDAAEVRRVAPGPGEWVRKNESMSEHSRRYQEFNGGRPGEVYRVERGGERADFDSIDQDVLVDSKGRYEHLFKDGEPQQWTTKTDDMMDQARRQADVASGRPIEWRFAENGDAYRYFRREFARENIPIRVRHVPMPD
jgi:Restriction endonuclease fold toxin 5